MGLGKWAVIDIETTGINAGEDDIIDLGYWQFEGTALVKRFASLVKTEHVLSPFISKLTGISQSMVTKAPVWDKVESDLLELEGHALIAHNASFEQKFLERYFDKRTLEFQQRETFQDSIFYLALIFPQYSQLNLEFFIRLFGIADNEEHRGEADARDLLKVMILATMTTYQDLFWRTKLEEVFETLPEGFWFKEFLLLEKSELRELAEVMDLNIEKHLKIYGDSLSLVKVEHNYKPLDLNFSKESIQKILQDEKLMQERLPRYKYRASQEEMASRVGQAFKNEIHALIQAPTGTGKTLGYLLPASLFYLETKQPVLITTGTKTLQQQVIAKDVPQVQALLGEHAIKITRLIGSQNHLCELLYREEEQNRELNLEEDSLYAKAYLELLFSYNQNVPYEKKLTREDIPYVLKKIWKSLAEKESALAVDYKACLGSQCPFAKDCSYLSGLREAKESALIVGNHSLLLNWPRSFPRPEFIIVDEAHKIESEATSSFTMELSHQSFEQMIKHFGQGMGALFYLLGTKEDSFAEDEIVHLRSGMQDTIARMRDHLLPLEHLMEVMFKKLPNYTPFYFNELPFPKKVAANDPSRVALINHMESLSFILTDYYSQLIKHQDEWSKKDLSQEAHSMKARVVFDSFWGLLEKHVVTLKQLLETPETWCSVIKFQEEQGYFLSSSPIDVGEVIARELLGPSRSVVFTSATLANAQGDTGSLSVEWMTGYTYLSQDKRFKRGFYLPPVFDYTHKAKVFLATDTKPISDPQFVVELLDQVIPLIQKLSGRTLLLFSSKARFELASDYLLRKLEGKLPLFIQGMGKTVVDDFKRAGMGVLVGMESFGEGIDVPGEGLQFIVIDKVPDLRQELVIQARREFFERKFGNEFQEYFLAQRARSLHQKCGRLLRHEEDFGAILICDQRLNKWKSGTLRSFKKLMEPYVPEFLGIEESVKQIETWLSR